MHILLLTNYNRNRPGTSGCNVGDVKFQICTLTKALDWSTARLLGYLYCHVSTQHHTLQLPQLPQQRLHTRASSVVLMSSGTRYSPHPSSWFLFQTKTYYAYYSSYTAVMFAPI
ncbi:hypothetical protein XENOCAPTIV_022922 [Xenoophorus captivus]|uniref:Uncharacterized protein n=1 Tax=Xenoophorus captivus TaxID=1517983 RepID=A0ABV0QJS0_9TELE